MIKAFFDRLTGREARRNALRNAHAAELTQTVTSHFHAAGWRQEAFLKPVEWSIYLPNGITTHHEAETLAAVVSSMGVLSAYAWNCATVRYTARDEPSGPHWRLMRFRFFDAADLQFAEIEIMQRQDWWADDAV